MNVKELIAFLEKQEQERIVVLSSDCEGNTYNALDECSLGMFHREDQDVGLEKLTPELIKAGFGKEDVYSDGEKAVILYPM